ncbi:hypothetical protein BVD23_09830 [Salmonella enterica]|nr:hypothetical protein [Salmonella enterica]EAN4946038.1 hypothetical protein [Salmonella enterica]EBI7618014.1 hypothetical protein [Salmonella enterica]EBI8099924.1 hypothetical protein [Salmonella enterica]EBK3005140.1 hypothetical protein [Salmonella enterica]
MVYFFALRSARHVALFIKHQNQSTEISIIAISRAAIFIPERGGVLFSAFYINGLTRRCRGYLYNYWSNNNE